MTPTGRFENQGKKEIASGFSLIVKGRSVVDWPAAA
jgi:hypothetical protein